jgi:hypothetical protein
MNLQDFTDVSFVGFDNETIEEIKEECLRFVNFKFSPNGGDFQYLNIDGSVFNNNNNYFLHPCKGGFGVQVTPKPRDPICYKFGFMILEENDRINFRPYHNPHGPFKN